MNKCGLLGRNIGYSKSPIIHNDYYRKVGISLSYELFDIEENEIEVFLNNLERQCIIGFNVTIPYKEKIIKYLDRIEYPVNKIRAVNTVLVKNNELIGYNTDYIGFLKSIEEYDLEGKKVLILGNGGAAKCVSCVFLDLKCGSIDIAVRNESRAKEYFGNHCSIILFDNLNDLSKYDMIVNCTPLGSVNYINEKPISLKSIKENCIVYDLIYNPVKTKFLEEAERYGAIIINGEKMLRYQAYAAADIWINYMLGNR